MVNEKVDVRESQQIRYRRVGSYGKFLCQIHDSSGGMKSVINRTLVPQGFSGIRIRFVRRRVRGQMCVESKIYFSRLIFSESAKDLLPQTERMVLKELPCESALAPPQSFLCSPTRETLQILTRSFLFYRGTHWSVSGNSLLQRVHRVSSASSSPSSLSSSTVPECWDSATERTLLSVGIF